MSKRITIITVFVFFTFFMNIAFSEMEYPKDLEKEIAPYPKANIVQTMKASGNTMVIMEVSDKLDTIFEFYKKELSAKGWTILGEIKQQGNYTLMGEKESKSVVIAISLDDSGKSMVSLTLAPK